MSFLKRVSEAEGKKIIKEMIHTRIGGPEKARGKHTIHASDLTKQNNQWGVAYCPREVRLAEIQDPPRKRPSPFLQVPTAVTFDEGRDKQKRLNEHWLVDVMWGAWNCLACARRIAWGLRPDGCACGAITNCWRYEEPRIIDHVSKTSGGLDAVVDVGEPKLRIIECKIMKSDDFKKLVAPLSEHRVRTRLYLRQIAGSKQEFAKKIETDFAHILYIMRGHGYKQEDGIISPFKEFIIERDDTEVQHFIGMAHALTLSRKKEWGNEFPAGICSTQMCARAKSCPVSKTCFSAHTGTITWMKDGAPVHTGENIKHVTDGEEVNEYGSG